jgi:predicted Rossmann-fold nucleotide-binding protein
MRLIVCGGRAYADRDRVFAALDRVHGKRTITTLIHGDAPGADRLADEWAQWHAVRREPYPADWDKFGKVAGPERNQRMIDAGADGVVAFPGGTGTADLVRRAERAGISVWKPYG